jgi:hypothetical protein
MAHFRWGQAGGVDDYHPKTVVVVPVVRVVPVANGRFATYPFPHYNPLIGAIPVPEPIWHTRHSALRIPCEHTIFLAKIMRLIYS